MSAVDALYRAGLLGAYTGLRVYWRLRKPTTEGACVAVWRGSEVLLIQNSYKQTLSLPGGGRHEREPWDAAAARELREEVGVVVEASALVPAYAATSTIEHKLDHVRFFEHRVDVPPALRIDHREVVWAAFVDAREALKLPLWPMVREYLQHALDRR